MNEKFLTFIKEDLFMYIVVLSFGACVFGMFSCFVIGSFRFVTLSTEKECFSFYTKNGYILDDCKCYEDKLTKLEMNE